MANRLKLNEKTVREAENLGRDYQIFDTDVRGFSITIYPSGYRAFNLDLSRTESPEHAFVSTQ